MQQQATVSHSPRGFAISDDHHRVAPLYAEHPCFHTSALLAHLFMNLLLLNIPRFNLIFLVKETRGLIPKGSKDLSLRHRV
jgi:hypothetical protein